MISGLHVSVGWLCRPRWVRARMKTARWEIREKNHCGGTSGLSPTSHVCDPLGLYCDSRTAHFSSRGAARVLENGSRHSRFACST